MGWAHLLVVLCLAACEAPPASPILVGPGRLAGLDAGADDPAGDAALADLGPDGGADATPVDAAPDAHRARLWAPDVVDADRWWSTPLALELQYARRLVGRLIAERSIEEMRRQQPIAADRAADWLEAMNGLFPDVAGGDRLCGVLLPGESARFYFNGRARGELRDPDFARLFFGIWLAPETSEPALRGQLLGLAR